MNNDMTNISVAVPHSLYKCTMLVIIVKQHYVDSFEMGSALQKRNTDTTVHSTDNNTATRKLGIATGY